MVRRARLGFTIVELLIVIVVIAILAAISIVAYNGIQNRAKASTAASDLKSISKSLESFIIDNSIYPCFDHAWDDTLEKSWSSKYMSKWPLNPWGGHYHWENYTGPVSISIENIDQNGAQALDDSIDDKNLSTGNIRGGAGRVEFYGVNQNIPRSSTCQ